MKRWKDCLISQEAKIRDVIKIIDASSLQIALVVDENNHLLGTVTDGDIRRGIISGLSLDEPVGKVMYKTPTFIRRNEGRESAFALMRQKSLRHIPVVDEEGCVVDLEILEDIIHFRKHKNWVVIMAGGLGMRLRPLTETLPKPLITVGKKPILETILENLIEYGFERFFFSVNYKAELFQDHFGDGSKWGVEIKYLQEEKKMGTAGALALLPDRPTVPLIVINGDVLTKVNFNHLLEFHARFEAKATMCVREYSFQVPYGVVHLERHFLIGIEEKPVQRFFVNGGIYVLNPSVLDLIPQETPYDITKLFEQILRDGLITTVFPIREYWMDIGQMDDLEKATEDFTEIFK